MDRVWKGLVLIREGQRAIQPLKLEPYYQEIRDGRSWPEVLERIATDYTDLQARYGLDKSVDAKEQEEFCSKLHIAVWNFKANRDILGGIPYLKFHDLAIVPMRREESGISVPVLRVDAKELQIPAGKILKKAIQNNTVLFPPRIWEQTDSDKRIDLKNGTQIDNIHQWFTLSNSMQAYGAALITDMDVLQKVREKLGSDFYILLPSFHELTIVPKISESHANPGALKTFMEQVTEKKRLFLSKNIYEYNQEKRCVYMYDGHSQIETNSREQKGRDG